MLKDTKLSSHVLHLSQLQSVNHKILDEYRDRLKTYEDSLWFGKSEEISAIECARRGWRCRTKDRIECINCHAELLAQMPSVLQIDSYREASRKLAQALVDAHHQYCVWKFMIIPPSTIELTDIYSTETINRYLRLAESFLSKFHSINIIGPLNQILVIEPTNFDLLSSSHLNDKRLLSAFKIVIFCWQLSATSLICEKCCREISLNSEELIMDPIQSHRAWCPILVNQHWKRRVEQINSILHKKSRDHESINSLSTDQNDEILKEILSTQEFFHELIPSKEYYRSCVQNTFNDQASDGNK